MKILLALLIATTANIASAQYTIQLIYTQDCESRDLQTQVKLVYNSSLGDIYGPITFQINGFDVEKAGLQMETGSEYTKFRGRLESGEVFSLNIKLYKNISQADLKLDGWWWSEDLNCKTVSKRVNWH